MNITQLYEDHHVDYIVGGHSHSTAGWVNTHCPHCAGSQNYHLGFNTEGNYFHCWRCGGHDTAYTIGKLIGIPRHAAELLIEDYAGPTKEVRVKVTRSQKPFQYPSGSLELTSYHKRYLEKRNFCWEKLQEDWGIMGTGPSATLDGGDYRNRILAPITWDKRTVSFQARDITGRHKLKYKACPKEREYVHHQHILYGMPSKWTRRGICVEGIFDAWRLGTNAFATFGISFTSQQAWVIHKFFDEVVILYDYERIAQKQARKLQSELLHMGTNAVIEHVDTDPGDMPQDEADYLVKEILHRKRF